VREREQRLIVWLRPPLRLIDLDVGPRQTDMCTYCNRPWINSQGDVEADLKATGGPRRQPERHAPQLELPTPPPLRSTWCLSGVPPFAVMTENTADHRLSVDVPRFNPMVLAG